MNKSELISALVEEAKVSKKDAEAVLNAFTKVVKDTVANGEKIQLVGFGTFESRERAERTGRNPQTKETITIPASVVPAFRAGKEFKDHVNNKK